MKLIHQCAIAAIACTAAAGGQIFEGETMKILKRSGNPRPQDLRPFGAGSWSGDSQLWWTGAKPGDVLELALPVAEEGIYRMGAAFTKAADYGVFDVTLDGKPLARALDFYNNGVIPTGTIALGGGVELTAGDHRLGFTVNGANDAAMKEFMLGLDYVVLAKGADVDVAALGPKLKMLMPKLPSSGLKDGNAVDAEAKSPTEEQAAFTVPEGFEIELVASEETGLPKPVTAVFDDAGRMWSQTATEYPRDNDPKVWTQPGKDRVVIFDTPCARGPQTAHVFADGMVMPLSVLPYGKGAFVAQGPELLYLDDKNGDGKADDRRVLAHGFGVKDTHTLPHQLTQMPGGRIVYSQGVLNSGKMVDTSGKTFAFNKTLIASMKPDGTDTQIIGAGLNNIWSWALSRTGRVFIHEANDLGYSLVPFEEDTSYPSFIATKLHPASPLHPPTAEGLHLGGTGFSGLAICDDKSGSFPAPWHGLIYVANPITGRINAASMTLGAQGVWTFKKHDDLVSCADPMFRPVSITFGPDGCLYIVDWYNRIISHNEVARDHPGRDKTHGRIWRVRSKNQPPASVPDMTIVPNQELPTHLAAANTWEMRAAWHQIGQRHATELAPALVAIAEDEKAGDDTRIHALWSLEDLGNFDEALWRKLIANPSADIRSEAIRALSTLRVPEDAAFSMLQSVSAESEWRVRYEVLRFFRKAAGPVNPAHIAWLRKWDDTPAPETKIKAWNGEYLALDGSYQRAFQDFLLTLAETKTGAALVAESKWDKVIATQPVATAEQSAQITHRVATVRAALGTGNAAAGKPLFEALCLTCHSIGGKGVGFAPPLDGSKDRDPDGLITAILDPDQAAESVFRLYRIETNAGVKFEGFKKSESDTEITLLQMGGAAQPVPIADIKSAGYVAGKSVMPPIAAGLADPQLADILAYLRGQ